ncbi:hypothetical protein ARMSODRAFT_1089106 [Armillaria solidipes]|uniref:Uncharacterized protein n=1 Tax=Armillaria solidipes TaxID=1076256 RepID=A0A2H3AYC9_9AGAR|nr:hypothetical protein ARMSODRAFT_1089106 [Armillaria solidipes]
MCVLEHGPYFQRLDVNDRSGPWKLGQVCSLWRQIANNTPSLWTRLSLTNSEVVKDPVSKFKVALERSSCLALNLELSLGDAYPLEVQGEIYQLAIAHSWQWEHLTITPSHLILPFLSDIGRHQLVKLTRLLHTNYAGALSELPWNHIVEFFDFRLWGDSESVHRVLDIIQQSPNVQILHVPIICSSPATTVRLPTPLVRSSLRDLTACEGPILRSLVVPQLEKISLAPGEDATDYCPDDALPALLDLIQRSRCSLTSLELTDVIFTDLLLDILHCTPGIKTLIIFTQGWESSYDRIFKALIHRLVLHPAPQ